VGEAAAAQVLGEFGELTLDVVRQARPSAAPNSASQQGLRVMGDQLESSSDIIIPTAVPIAISSLLRSLLFRGAVKRLDTPRNR